METLTCLFFLIFQASAKIGMPLRDRGDTQTSLASNVLAKTKYPATDDTAGISKNRKYARVSKQQRRQKCSENMFEDIYPSYR